MAQHVQRLQQRRQFAERQQAGDVGHRGRDARDLRIDHLQRAGIEQHGCGAGDRASVFEADVETGDGAQRVSKRSRSTTRCASSDCRSRAAAMLPSQSPNAVVAIA